MKHRATEAERIVARAMDALETGATHEQRRAAWYELRNLFFSDSQLYREFEVKPRADK